MLRRPVSSEPKSDRQEKAFNDPGSEFTRGLHREGEREIPTAEFADRMAACFGRASAACNLGILLDLQQPLADPEAAYRRAHAIRVFNLAA